MSVVEITKVPPTREREEPETPAEAQILELAADIIETEGWCQHSFSAWGHRCAVGGIGAAVKRLSFARGKKAEARWAAENRLKELVLASAEPDFYRHGEDRDIIIRWNDSPRTHKDQVIRRLREAAASLMPKS